MTARTVCWFSAGAASAVATKLALRADPSAVVVYTDPGSEHPDNARFLDDAARWLGVDIQRLKSDRYQDTWELWATRRFLVSPAGALCTVELKKRQRLTFQRPDDVQVFGYTADRADAARAARFREQNPGVELSTPLIDRGLTKSDCLAILQRAGLTLPAMYLLGYRNNNCVGCVKGGMGYWNKIRVDFPDTFARMAALERQLGATVLRDESGPVPLDTLDPARGDYPSEPSLDCSLLCALAESDL